MPRNRHRYFQEEEEDDNFETEAFAHLNEEQADESVDKHDTEQDVEEDSDPEDMQHLEDSDDEAPDDVGFHESREAVLTQLRSALRQVDVEKQKQKGKRKLLDAQFKEQKAKRQEDLAKSKLPEDFFQGLDDVIPKKIKKTVPSADRKKKTKKAEHKEDEEDKDIVDDDDDDDDEDAANLRVSAESENFIAFTDSASGVQVADFKHVEKQSGSMMRAALNFRQNRLYGKGVKRESNQQRLAKAEKRKHRGR